MNVKDSESTLMSYMHQEVISARAIVVLVLSRLSTSHRAQIWPLSCPARWSETQSCTQPTANPGIEPGMLQPLPDIHQRQQDKSVHGAHLNAGKCGTL